MIAIRRSHERGHDSLGWLDSYHTFSFASYYDPDQMGFRQLRVINQDHVQPGYGFPLHSHRDMEIISYVLQGALEHEDSLGHRSSLRSGEVQVISAGTGIAHGEHNRSRTEPVHFLQIWVVPDRSGLRPRYAQKAFSEQERRGRLCLIASGDSRDGSLQIHQDASVYASLLDAGQQVVPAIAPGRHVWVHVARGTVQLNDHLLDSGDGAAVSEEHALTILASESAELLLFDLA